LARRIATIPTLLLVVAAGLVTGTGFANAAAATDLYVSNYSGDGPCSDTGPGSQTKPFCDIQTAANLAQPGQTVHVALNPNEPFEGYGETDITRSGAAGKPITFVGTPRNGYLPVVGSSSAHGFTVSGAQDIVISGFEPEGSSASVTIDDSSQITVNGLRLQDTDNDVGGGAIAVTGSSSEVTISRNYGIGLTRTSFVSIGQGVSDTTVTDNEFGSGGVAAILATGASNTVVTGNTVDDNCGSSIDLEGNSPNSTVENNIVQGVRGTVTTCESAQIVVSAGSAVGTTADHNLIDGASSAGPLYNWAATPYMALAAFTTATGQGAHDIDADPGFAADREPGDVQLTEHSPAIDSADANAPGELSTDLLGKARVDDTLVPNTGTGSGIVDRGAFEFQDPMTVSLATSPAKGPAPLPVTATATADNPWGTAVSYSFDFGDGSAPVVTSTPSTSHTYSAEGNTNTITVTATAADGASGIATATVQVVAPAPLVAALDTYQNAELTVVGDGSKTSDSWAITDYSFDFGDGSAPQAGTASTQTHHYPKPGTYTVSLTVTDSAGNTNTATSEVVVGSAYQAIQTIRLLDTRNGTGAPQAQLGAGGVLGLQITGNNNIPTTGITAVVLDVTAANPTANSFLTVWPDGTTQPTLSTVNFQAGATVRNLVTVPVGANGKVDFFNNTGSTDVIADLEGVYSDSATQGVYGTDFSVPVQPSRVLDTRNGTGDGSAGQIGAGRSVTVGVNPQGTLSGATAVVLNVTVTNPTTAGNLTVYQSDLPSVPTEPNVSFSAGQTISNLVIVPVDFNDQISFFNATGSVDVTADIQGYYQFPPTGAPTVTSSAFTPTPPTRIMDTRNGTGGVPTAPVGPNSDLVLQVAGVDGIPANVTAVDLNVTDVNPTASGYLTITATGGAGTTTNLHFGQGQILSDQVLVPVGPDGKIRFHNYTGSTDLVAGLSGYFQS
jgi:PKD repeat protein